MAYHQRLLLVSWNLLFLHIILISVTNGDNESIAGDNNKGHKSLVVCKLNAGPLRLPGSQGIKGESGEKGEPGDKGLSGLLGSQGIKGESGAKGEKGDSGSSGLPGSQGIKGESGAKGEKGDPGSSGLPGSQGIEGKSGTKGEKGDPGRPGTPGKCAVCSGGSKKYTSPETYGYENDPATLLCKDENPKSIRKEWFVGPELDAIQVYCKDTDSTTCVVGSKLDSVTFGGGETKPFWLSQRGLKTVELNSLSISQLQWLQERSSSVYQIIKYHCNNTQPFYRDNLDKSILLLTWNGMVIGPEPSLTSPLYYIVPEDTDNCSRAKKNEWSHTEIIVKTDFVQRLPVIDFLIRDVKNETQQVQIENVEICFE